MSFSSDVKNEVKNKHFTSRKHHSRINNCGLNDQLLNQDLIIESFLRCGTISDPEKFYHLEFVCETNEEAKQLQNAAGDYGIATGLNIRKDKHIVYIKDSEAISDMLVILGATNAVLKYENIRILKEMKENVQRRVNCETANIGKTVSAAMKQLEDIQLIKSRHCYSALPDGLKEAAELRIKNPDASLSELAEKMPDTGKSGLNHRFRKLAKIAEQLRQE